MLADVDEHPYPAELAVSLCMPKPSVTLYVKRLEAAGFLRREIDPEDLRRAHDGTSALMPVSARPMISFWICDVPSYSVVTRTSRK